VHSEDNTCLRDSLPGPDIRFKILDPNLEEAANRPSLLRRKTSETIPETAFAFILLV
jgi:hypothetical protein